MEYTNDGWALRGGLIGWETKQTYCIMWITIGASPQFIWINTLDPTIKMNNRHYGSCQNWGKLGNGLAAMSH